MENFDTLIDSVTRLAQPVCAALAIEIVDVNVRAHRGDVHIQVFADRPDGGIGMDACAALNKRLAAALDNGLDLGDNYTLEVSSPGLDRTLRGYRDLRRVLGREVQVFLKEQVNGRHEVSGLLDAVSETDAVLKTRQGDVVVPMGKIEKARQIIN